MSQIDPTWSIHDKLKYVDVKYQPKIKSFITIPDLPQIKPQASTYEDSSRISQQEISRKKSPITVSLSTTQEKGEKDNLKNQSENRICLLKKVFEGNNFEKTGRRHFQTSTVNLRKDPNLNVERAISKPNENAGIGTAIVWQL